MSPPNRRSPGPATTPGSSGSDECAAARTGRGARSGAYEYRCWPSAGLAAALQRRLARGWERRSEPPRSDVYLLPRNRGGRIASLAKLRDGRVLEIKLWRRNAGRLQFWQPGMRSGFPLAARAREALGRALAMPPPPGESAAALCAALEEGPVRLITVTKQRQLFSRTGSRVEVSRISVPGGQVRSASLRWSVALDDPDARRAGAALARLGLHRLANLNYGQALTAIDVAAPLPASEDER